MAFKCQPVNFKRLCMLMDEKINLLILDEPTSALDPLAESEVYENFNQLTQGRCAIFISHRMSSSIFCDRILVLDNGRVADFNSHEKLIKKRMACIIKCLQLKPRTINYHKMMRNVL